MHFYRSAPAFVAICVSAGSHAAITLDTSFAPTPDLPGFVTHTINVSTDLDGIGGFQGLFNALGSGFQGTLHQATGGATPLAGDTSGSTQEQDSHFGFSSSDDLLLLPGAPLIDSTTELGGIFTILPDARETDVLLAQIVAPVDASINYNFAVSEASGSSANSETFTGTLSVPTYIAGDYNGDGRVDQLDLNLVLFNWNSSDVPAGWNALRQIDGAIDQIELNGVLFNWNNTDLVVASSLISTVALDIPEPASGLLVGLISSAAFARRRRLTKH